MQCFVYRSRQKQGTYLILPEQVDNIDHLPDSLTKVFGSPEFSFEFMLSPERQLMRIDAPTLQKALNEQGFYLQLPPGEKLSRPSMYYSP